MQAGNGNICSRCQSPYSQCSCIAWTQKLHNTQNIAVQMLQARVKELTEAHELSRKANWNLAGEVTKLRRVVDAARNFEREATPVSWRSSLSLLKEALRELDGESLTKEETKKHAEAIKSIFNTCQMHGKTGCACG